MQILVMLILAPIMFVIGTIIDILAFVFVFFAAIATFLFGNSKE